MSWCKTKVDALLATVAQHGYGKWHTALDPDRNPQAYLLRHHTADECATQWEYLKNSREARMAARAYTTGDHTPQDKEPCSLSESACMCPACLRRVRGPSVSRRRRKRKRPEPVPAAAALASRHMQRGETGKFEKKKTNKDISLEDAVLAGVAKYGPRHWPVLFADVGLEPSLRGFVADDLHQVWCFLCRKRPRAARRALARYHHMPPSSSSSSGTQQQQHQRAKWSPDATLALIDGGIALQFQIRCSLCSQVSNTAFQAPSMKMTMADKCNALLRDARFTARLRGYYPYQVGCKWNSLLRDFDHDMDEARRVTIDRIWYPLVQP